MSQQLTFADALRRARARADVAIGRAERVTGAELRDRAAAVILDALRQGPLTSEQLSARIAAAGIRFTDGRHAGAVVRKLSGRGQIRCIASGLPRVHGNGTSGARLWALVEGGGDGNEHAGSVAAGRAAAPVP